MHWNIWIKSIKVLIDLGRTELALRRIEKQQAIILVTLDDQAYCQVKERDQAVLKEV